MHQQAKSGLARSDEAESEDSEHVTPIDPFIQLHHSPPASPLDLDALYGLDRQYRNGVKLKRFTHQSAAHLKINSFRQCKAVCGYQYHK